MTQQPGSAETKRYRMEATVYHGQAPDMPEPDWAEVEPVEALNGEWVKWEDVRTLRTENAQLQAQCDGLRYLIDNHNAGCQEMCGVGELEAAKCGYRPYFVNSGRRCTTCPTDWMIEVPT